MLLLFAHSTAVLLLFVTFVHFCPDLSFIVKSMMTFLQKFIKKEGFIYSLLEYFKFILNRNFNSNLSNSKISGWKFN